MTQSKTLMASRMNRKGSCPVLSGGKSSDNIKGLPIAIGAGWGYQDERQADPGADGAGLTNQEIRSLFPVQFQGNPFFIGSFLEQ